MLSERRGEWEGGAPFRHPIPPHPHPPSGAFGACHARGQPRARRTDIVANTEVLREERGGAVGSNKRGLLADGWGRRRL